MNRQTRLEHIYGIPFPDSFFAFWDFAQTHDSLLDLLGIGLVGPFDELREREDRSGWAARYYDDPPEFLTLAIGSSDGLHWGYYIDDPGHPSFPVVSFYSKDFFSVTVSGETLFEAVRLELECMYRDNLDSLQEDSEGQTACEERLSQLALVRSALQTYETGERSEVGGEYREKYFPEERRHPTAPTRDGMGIVVPASSYIPLQQTDPFQNRDYQPDKHDVERDAAKALRLLALGFPGAALKLGKDLWTMQTFRETSYALLDAAYTALKRDLLSIWLDKARAYRHECDAKRLS